MSEPVGKVVITGAAGLLGQNLIQRLLARGIGPIVAIDKNRHNAEILATNYPGIEVIVADLAEPGSWADAFAGCQVLVHGHAQIGGLEAEEFWRNNAQATEQVLAAAKAHAVPYVVNISSSVVNSLATDNYTETKKAQEKLVADSGIAQIILRPTLMFGWFDRKHLGWLARFMERMPVFPVPGNGKFLRQPLYVGDFCEIIISAMISRKTGAYNISGQEKIDYIDLIRELKRATGARARIVKLPYGVFWSLLKMYGAVSPNPPFTTKQLAALVTPDVFEVIDWPGIFGVRSTPVREAFAETFQHPIYSKVVLQF